MTVQTSTHRRDRHETDSANPEFNFDSFAPVLMMSCIGLTLSLLIITVVTR
jgi:hypothetical protein